MSIRLLKYSALIRNTTSRPLLQSLAQLSRNRQSSQFSRPTMEKITTKNAMAPAGPYSQAIRAPPFLFVSGQIPADPSGALVGGSIADQTRRCCESIKAILAEAGSSIDKVVKVNVFITDMANFAEMNGAYGEYFSHLPARSCVAVKQLPKDVPVEIECIALA